MQIQSIKSTPKAITFGMYEEQTVTTTTHKHDIPEQTEREELNKLLRLQQNQVSSVERDSFSNTTTLSIQPNTQNNIRKVTFPYELTAHSAPIIIETEHPFGDTIVRHKRIISETETSNLGNGLRTIPERLRIKANQTIAYLLELAKKCPVHKP